MCGGEGTTVIVAAVDERQAMIVFGIARRMVEILSRTAILRRLGMSDDEIAEEHALSLIFQLTCFTTRYATHTRG